MRLERLYFFFGIETNAVEDLMHAPTIDSKGFKRTRAVPQREARDHGCPSRGRAACTGRIDAMLLLAEICGTLTAAALAVSDRKKCRAWFGMGGHKLHTFWYCVYTVHQTQRVSRGDRLGRYREVANLCMST